MSYRVIETNLEKPSLDDKIYELIELPNKLQVMLISHKETTKSTAAMDVNVGHFMDPEDCAGLAHFLEHLLFLGTKKYPEEGSYQAYIQKSGGSTNAYTDMENTNFFFDCTPDALEEALDRFAQFFICPLFNEDCTAREMNAVHSEHTNNLLVDNWRGFQLLKSTSNPAHPFSKFGSGSMETLDEIPKQKGINVREELIKFHAKYYSANRMKLCVLGKEPIETLRQWVIEKFSPIENKDVTLPSFSSIPCHSPEQIKHIFKIVPIKDIRGFSLLFPVNLKKEEFYEVKPDMYYSHLIGHEGAGSAYSMLKNLSWVSAISSSLTFSFTEQAFFSIDINLTEEGENHVNDILLILFQYIKLVRDCGVQKWIIDECRDISDIAFRFLETDEPINYGTSVASNMQKYKPEHILSGAVRVHKYDEQAILKFAQFITPDNLIMFYTSKAFEKLENLQKERWYGTPYAREPFDSELLKLWANPPHNDDLKLPEPNSFIPTDFALKPLEEETEYPVLIKKSSYVEMWFKQDNVFKQPKGSVIFCFTIPGTYSTPQNFLLSQFFCNLIEDELAEFSYAAKVAGYAPIIEGARFGFTIIVTGYNHKIDVLREKLFERILNISPSKERFEVLKEKAIMDMKNSLMNQPYAYGFSKVDQLINLTRYHNEDFLEIIDGITFEYLKSFIVFWLRTVSIQGLIHGNFTKTEAMTISEKVEKQICKDMFRMLPVQEPFARVLKFDQGYDYVLAVNNPNQEDTNSSVEVIYFIGPINAKDQVLLELLNQILSTPYYDQLRTKEQIGYIVTSRDRLDFNVLSLSLVVQSQQDHIHIVERSDAFMASFFETLKQMPEEEVQENIAALMQLILEKDKQLMQETTRHFMEIVSRNYLFDRKFIKSKALEGLKKADLVKFFETYLILESPVCHRVITEVVAKQHSEKLKEIPNKKRKTIIIEDVHKFKASMPTYPSIVPYH